MRAAGFLPASIATATARTTIVLVAQRRRRAITLMAGHYLRINAEAVAGVLQVNGRRKLTGCNHEVPPQFNMQEHQGRTSANPRFVSPTRLTASIRIGREPPPKLDNQSNWRKCRRTLQKNTQNPMLNEPKPLIKITMEAVARVMLSYWCGSQRPVCEPCLPPVLHTLSQGATSCSRSRKFY